MREVGKTIFSMAKVLKVGHRGQPSKVSITKDWKKAAVNTPMQMERLMRANGSKIWLTATEHIFGRMVRNTMDNGLKTRWMATAFTNTLIKWDTMGNSLQIRNKASESTLGQMAASMKDGGTRVSSMVTVPILIEMLRWSTECGSTARMWSGTMIKQQVWSMKIKGKSI